MDPKFWISIGLGVVAIAIASYLIYKWSQLKKWARNWLDGHEGYRKVYCDMKLAVIELAAAVKRNMNEFRLKVFAEDSAGRVVTVVSDEQVKVDEKYWEAFKKKIEEDPVLAMKS